MSVVIRPTRLSDVPSLVDALNTVFNERVYLAITESIPVGEAMNYHASHITEGLPHFVALDGDRVVGLSDIAPCGSQRIAAQQHNGRFGMFLLPDYRGRGLGEPLLRHAIDASRGRFSRIELSVYSHNERAHKLYKKTGFIEEGRRIGAWKLDGITSDIIEMVYLHKQ